MARRFHYRRLQHTFAVAAAMGADWQVTEEPGEGIEVGCFAGLAELNGASGDLRTDMAWVDSKGTLGVGQRFVQPVSVKEEIADVRVHLKVARLVAEGAFEGVQGFAGTIQVAVNEAKGDRAGMARGELVSAGSVAGGLGEIEAADEVARRAKQTGVVRMGGDRVPDEPEGGVHRRAQAGSASTVQESPEVDGQVGHDP